jgi:hypothetical protein
MTSQTKANLGGALKALSLSLLGTAATILAFGGPKWLPAACGISGALTGCAGVFFSTLFANAQQAQIATGAAIDRGEAIQPIPASVLPTPQQPKIIPPTFPAAPPSTKP